jgi:hypothetical protein
MNYQQILAPFIVIITFSIFWYLIEIHNFAKPKKSYQKQRGDEK